MGAPKLPSVLCPSIGALARALGAGACGSAGAAGIACVAGIAFAIMGGGAARASERGAARFVAAAPPGGKPSFDIERGMANGSGSP
jgi:hypothetical protein